MFPSLVLTVAGGITTGRINIVVMWSSLLLVPCVLISDCVEAAPTYFRHNTPDFNLSVDIFNTWALSSISNNGSEIREDQWMAYPTIFLRSLFWQKYASRTFIPCKRTIRWWVLAIGRIFLKCKLICWGKFWDHCHFLRQGTTKEVLINISADETFRFCLMLVRRSKRTISKPLTPRRLSTKHICAVWHWVIRWRSGPFASKKYPPGCEMGRFELSALVRRYDPRCSITRCPCPNKCQQLWLRSDQLSDCQRKNLSFMVRQYLYPCEDSLKSLFKGWYRFLLIMYALRGHMNACILGHTNFIFKLHIYLFIYLFVWRANGKCRKLNVFPLLSMPLVSTRCWISST